jgi:SOS-response transcriptional repressor LexA
MGMPPMNIKASSDKIYRFIVERCIASGGHPPQIREIMAEFGISSTSAVRYRLQRMADYGLIEYHPRISRGITVVGGKWIPPEGYGADSD